VLHELAGKILGVQDAELCEDAGVSIVESEALLHQLNELGRAVQPLVVEYELLEVVRMNDDMKTAYIR
jgi:hypothetical protein